MLRLVGRGGGGEKKGQGETQLYYLVQQSKDQDKEIEGEICSLKFLKTVLLIKTGGRGSKGGYQNYNC